MWALIEYSCGHEIERNGVLNMTEMKINERIALLRRQKGCTQEQLAAKLGVTNQSVSKWESGQCCPDIQLLPEIAAFFGVTIDFLMGAAPAEGLSAICLRIREHLSALPERRTFEDCYRIAALLHEAALTDGYKEKLPWKEGRDYAVDEVGDWGLSVRNEAEGVTVRRCNSVFFSIGCRQKPPTGYQLRTAAARMRELGDPDVLAVLCALYDRTGGGDAELASVGEIAQAARMEKEKVRAVLEQLPVEEAEKDGEPAYRPADGFQHFMALLRMTFEI